MKIEDLFEKRCVNRFRAVDRGFRNKHADNPRPHPYLRKDLTAWAIKAFNRGDEFFYCRPVDPADPKGKQELCEPEYRYFIKDKNGLSEEEFALITGGKNG